MAPIDDILGRLEELGRTIQDARAKEQLGALAQQIKSYAGDQEAQQKKLSDQIAQDQATITQLQASQTALQSQVSDLQAQVADLQKRLDAEPAVTRTSPIDLVQAFRGMIDQVQAEARGSPEAAVTIKAMDIEVKSLVEIAQNQTALVLPSVKAPIDVGALSTMRVSFGAVPSIQPPAEPAPTPPSPPPPPSTTPRSAPGPPSPASSERLRAPSRKRTRRRKT